MNKDNAKTPTGRISEELKAIFPGKDEMVAWENTAGHDRFPDVYQIIKSSDIIRYTADKNIFHFYDSQKTCLRISYQTDEIIRITYAIEGEFESDFSYALDPDFSPQRPTINLEEIPEHFRLTGSKLHCLIDKKNCQLTITDVKGNILSKDAGGFQQTSTILKGVTEVLLEKEAFPSEVFYGLGDKSGDLNLRGDKFENWNTDAFGYGSSSDPLYRSIPFFYGLREGQAYGIFLDNTHRSWFDFDSKKENKLVFSAAAGEMNYYFIAGPGLMEVAKRYTDLTGKAELLPMWGLGFHQCRWSYYPEARVMEIANEFRNRKIPCDALYLDIDYMEGYRCFTVNEKHFPDLNAMTGTLASMGFHTIVMIDPGIRVDEAYHVYKEGKERDYFCRRKDGKLMRGPVWPTDCAFPDFTNSDVRKWWGDLYDKLYLEQGISGFWNDMNEPAVFKVNSKTFPEDVRHDFEGKGANHSRIHNIYGQQMARATQEGLTRLQPDKRPVVVTRATFSGGQRFSAAWTGDNVASWEHLAIANRQCQRMSISGFSFIGTDIGGFVDQPDGELMVRWLQLGVFHPFYRIHSMGNNDDGAAEADAERIQESERLNRLDQEPWVFGDEFTALNRAAIELRYRLQPYLYTSFWEHSTTGVPVIRQLAFYDQYDPKTHHREDEFFYGEHLLAVNVHQPGQQEKEVYLPKGVWVDYWTGESYSGLKMYKIKLTLDHIPIFIKAGSFIPHYPLRQHTSEPVNSFELHSYYGRGVFGQEIYEDKGEGYDYKKEDYLLRALNYQGTDNEISILQKIKGNFQPSYNKTVIVLHAVPFAIGKVVVDDHTVLFYKRNNNEYAFEVENNFEKIVVTSE